LNKSSTLTRSLAASAQPSHSVMQPSSVVDIKID